jgi:FkbH-like protein
MTSPSRTAGSDALKATVRALLSEGRYEDAWQQVRPLLLSGEDATMWNVARNLLRTGEQDGWSPTCKREIRLAVLCTYEAAELREHLDVACRALGVEAVVHAAPYGQLEQEVLDSHSGLATFEPTHVVIAPTTADLGFPELADDAEGLLAAQEHRWSALWKALTDRFRARVVQHTFVVPDETSLGHLALRLPGSRPSLVHELNSRLGAAAGAGVLLVDCDRLASRVGKATWSDPRLWYVARQPYSYGALPLLARETAAVLAGDLGLGARCLVVDLDNTLWGGVVGEDGADGIVVGDGADGEAYAAFQDYLRALKERGVVLAVASKNDAAAAREPFELNPRMRLGLADFAVFVADWRRKPEQLVEVAETLGLGFDALVFVDDNPAECAEVAAALPAVDTVPLGGSPSEFVRTLAASLRFEAPSLTVEDLGRQRSYLGRAQAEELRATATSLEDFWRSLDMRARVSDLDESTVERATQLTQKTNQFNLTLNRHSLEQIEQFKDDASAICRTLELEDRFATHGFVGLAIAVPDTTDPQTVVVDTLLLSCRVIGRTAENHLLAHLGRAALDAGFTRMRGIYVPGPRNALVADLYPRLGFVPSPVSNGDRWDYDLATNGPIESAYIRDSE